MFLLPPGHANVGPAVAPMVLKAAGHEREDTCLGTVVVVCPLSLWASLGFLVRRLHMCFPRTGHNCTFQYGVSYLPLHMDQEATHRNVERFDVCVGGGRSATCGASGRMCVEATSTSCAGLRTRSTAWWRKCWGTACLSSGTRRTKSRNERRAPHWPQRLLGDVCRGLMDHKITYTATLWAKGRQGTIGFGNTDVPRSSRFAQIG